MSTNQRSTFYDFNSN